MLPKLTLVLGGAASGKSSFAENLCQELDFPKFYLATAQPLDEEMRRKISRHRDTRSASWRTLEAPFDLVGPLRGSGPDEIFLIDCATLWLSNHLLAHNDVGAESAQLLAALGRAAASVVVVSNEVGGGIVPADALSRRFREAQGALNRLLAAKADLVVAVMAGLPLVLKGSLPRSAA